MSFYYWKIKIHFYCLNKYAFTFDLYLDYFEFCNLYLDSVFFLQIIFNLYPGIILANAIRPKQGKEKYKPGNIIPEVGGYLTRFG